MKEVPRAIRGALGFLSRLPVGRDERAWEAFRTAPWTLPVAGYLLGGLAAVPVAVGVLAPVPAVTVALAYVLAVVALTGINHFDGVADLGDAAVVHGDAERRREVMGDTALGVGGTLALAVVVTGLALAGAGLAALPVAAAVGLVVAAEVAAKAAMATLVALGSAAHDGFGAAVADETPPRGLVAPLVLAAPAVALTLPSLAAVAALSSGVGVALALLWWARDRLDGVTGDVIGGANELARVAALHAGLVAWRADFAVPVGFGEPVGLAVPVGLGEVVAWTLW
ncbi:adenosylcobinamide-GDP ribazoletransferase [Halosimplex rubrum]|uniref:Adenosylcobinamide-GDP ribazoletransferase n=1 Tax=Halosimplex rubrum TaxID=869889 RepID=A0A7D5T704_9EURY|nr:adenosylcobinamide-GDP ribazoletransferase [Halosimplex rubrum]